MYHDFSAGCKSKFVGFLVLNRIISGSRQNLDIEQAMIELYLRGIDDDGLYRRSLRVGPGTDTDGTRTPGAETTS